MSKIKTILHNIYIKVLIVSLVVTCVVFLVPWNKMRIGNALDKTLLNADATKIINEVHSQGGELTKNFIEKDIETHGYYRKMIFGFITPPEGNACIFNATFCLTLKNKCFKYYSSYWTRDLLEDTIKKFNDPAYGLKQIKSNLKWVDPDGKFEANIDSDGTLYILKIKMTDSTIK